MQTVYEYINRMTINTGMMISYNTIKMCYNDARDVVIIIEWSLKGKCNDFLTYYFYCIIVLYH